MTFGYFPGVGEQTPGDVSAEHRQRAAAVERAREDGGPDEGACRHEGSGRERGTRCSVCHNVIPDVVTPPLQWSSSLPLSFEVLFVSLPNNADGET